MYEGSAIMNQTAGMLARKYACALLNTYPDQFNITIFERMRSVIEYFNTNRQVLFFLRMSALDTVMKRRALGALCQKFELPPCIVNLLEVLAHHARLALVQDILSALCQEYVKRSALLEFEFVSPFALSHDDCQNMRQFLACTTGKTILYRCRLDPALIGGVRLVSTQLLWDYSLADQLRRITTAIAE